jgi:quinoprotein glucose dehydrogenase
VRLTASFALIIFLSASVRAQDNYKTWAAYGGSSDSSQYSSLSQINRGNVRDLKVAWTYPVQDHNHYFFNPIVVHGLMYVLAKDNSIVALDPATGKEIWAHATDAKSRLITNRGINYWESKDGSDRRLLFSQDNQLQAIDARTGRSIETFGKNGKVDLREGLGRNAQGIVLVQSTTPGRVLFGLMIRGRARWSGHSIPFRIQVSTGMRLGRRMHGRRLAARIRGASYQ